MNMSEPRLRTLLRQAEKTKNAGKRAAAAQLYREIVAEEPDLVEAWLGLGELSTDAAEKERAYRQALALDPENVVAQAGLAGEPLPEVAETSEPETAVSPPPPAMTQQAPAVQKKPAPLAEKEDDFILYCYRHPERDTSLRCYSCNKPICIDCANKTPVGYICPECLYNLEEKFFSATKIDYLLASVVSFILSLLAGFVVVNFGGGFFWVLIVLFVAGGVGAFVAKLTYRVIGGRRGRYIPHIVATMVIVGVVIPAFPMLIGILLGGLGALFSLLVPGIYAFVASSSAFYWMR
ncbi:MAG: hypothetical protein IPG51_15545 [Chloroflexi bacterium]|jgi:hypothetical protein|nr:hypothetical protein [Chloroflexota bacterium]